MNHCSYLNCREPGIWVDEDDGRKYCGAHLIYVRPVDDDESRQKRRDFADEYARDAAREGYER